MKLKQTCERKKSSADGREKELQFFVDLIPSEKDCSTPPMPTKSKSFFSTVV